MKTKKHKHRNYKNNIKYYKNKNKKNNKKINQIHNKSNVNKKLKKLIQRILK